MGYSEGEPQRVGIMKDPGKTGARLGMWPYRRGRQGVGAGGMEGVANWGWASCP